MDAPGVASCVRTVEDAAISLARLPWSSATDGYLNALWVLQDSLARLIDHVSIDPENRYPILNETSPRLIQIITTSLRSVRHENLKTLSAVQSSMTAIEGLAWDLVNQRYGKALKSRAAGK